MELNFTTAVVHGFSKRYLSRYRGGVKQGSLQYCYASSYTDVLKVVRVHGLMAQEPPS